jgi:cold shock CspA family protein
VKFRFKIYFDNLSEAELGALLWVLKIADDKRYRLKLGMGKPLGMGSVRVSANLHLVDRPARYSKLFGSNNWHEGMREDEARRRDAIAAFQRFVLEQLGRKEARQIDELERIRALLHILSWPGPGRALTRYMEIERPDPSAKRGKRNEYKGRPVLPVPEQLLQHIASEQKTPTESGTITSTKTTALPKDYQRGIIKEFGLGPRKSYGFIQIKGQTIDLFVHKNQLSNELLKKLDKGDTLIGETVVLTIGAGMKGPEARNVKLEIELQQS